MADSPFHSGRSGSSRGLRLVDGLLAVWVLVLLYGSLVPFDLQGTGEATLRRLDRAASYWPFGRAAVSRRDLASNVLFYVPFGFLVAGRFLLRRTEGGSAVAVVAAFVASLVLTSTVEALQLLSPTRTSSLTDVAANTVGGLLGGVAVAVFLARAWRRRIRQLAAWLACRPVRLAAAAVVILLALDALDPMCPVLHLSELTRNLGDSHLHLASGLRVHPWHHWLVCRVGVYALLAILIGASGSRSSAWRWVVGAGLAVLFAILSEAWKPFVAHRTANAANVVMAACGSAVGAVLAATLDRRLPARTKVAAAVFLLAAYLAYHEWKPFVLVPDVESVLAKMPSAEDWLPLRGYAAGSGGTGEIRLLVRAVSLTAALVFAASLWRRWVARRSRLAVALTAILLAAGLGLVLEAGQFLIAGRYPSPSHVLFFVAGGGVGACLALARWTDHPVPSGAEPQPPPH